MHEKAPNESYSRPQPPLPPPTHPPKQPNGSAELETLGVDGRRLRLSTIPEDS